MTTKSLTIIAVIATFIVISCEPNYEPYVDATSNVFKQLSVQSNGEIDSLIQRVEAIEEVQNFAKPLKSMSSDDEMQLLSAMINLSIDGDINIDSLFINSINTVFLHNKNNVDLRSFSRIDTMNVANGYEVKFMNSNEYSYDNSDAATLWQYASSKYKPLHTSRDSITAGMKLRIENSYKGNLARINTLKYIVLVDDVLLVPPVIDETNNGFITGYVLTHLYAYDIKSMEKLGQMMLVSSSSDEISYYTYSKSASISDASMTGRLRNDLMAQKSKAIDSLFSYGK